MVILATVVVGRLSVGLGVRGTVGEVGEAGVVGEGVGVGVGVLEGLGTPVLGVA
jgi:hypothetical protein